jgi:hypothetical protein
MKRLFITLSIIAMLGIITPSLPTLAQPVRIPHENPATATGSLDKVMLLLSYSRIINLAASRQYQDAQDFLNELRHADIPDELKYIFDRYSYLCQQLFTTLDGLESLLDETSTLLAHGHIHEAKQRLDAAEVDIQDALLLQEDIKVATDTLSDVLGVFTTPAKSQLGQAHTRLEESLERLSELIDRLDNLRQGQTERYIQMTGLIPTELSLNIAPAYVFVGDSITASGRLEGDGKPLSKKKLTLTLDNKPITTSTEIDGSYTINITIPYKYVAAMTLTALYEPSGDDTDIYLASQSPPVTINTMFYKTRLEISAPETAHPGLPFTISGRVSSTDGNIDRTIRVFLDDTQLAEETVSGQFNLEVTPSEQTPNDNHNLTISVPPQGRYSGASETRRISVSSLPMYVNAQTSTLVLLPKAVRVSGRVYHELGPVSDARVSLNLKNSTSTTITSRDGSFNSIIRLPIWSESAPLASNPFYFSKPNTGPTFDLSPIHPQQITITVEPLQPWHTSLTVKRQFVTINPLIMGLILVFLVTLGLLIYKKSQTRLPAEKGVPQAEVRELPTITPPPQPKPKFTGIKGRIIAAYRGGLEAVEKVSGIGMAPNITLREFLKMATLLLPTVIRPFAELTTITEITLYAGRRPREDTATRAEQLATTIKEELRRGTS